MSFCRGLSMLLHHGLSCTLLLMGSHIPDGWLIQAASSPAIVANCTSGRSPGIHQLADRAPK